MSGTDKNLPKWTSSTLPSASVDEVVSICGWILLFSWFSWLVSVTKIVKFILDVKRKTYANLTSGNIGTLFSQYHYYCKKNFPREMRGHYNDVMKVCRKTRIKKTTIVKNFPREMRGCYDDVMKVWWKTRIKYY